MNFSLINVSRINANGTIDGNWLQDCVGVSLEEATSRARATEAANNHGITVAVVESSNSFGVHYVTNQERLDTNTAAVYTLQHNTDDAQYTAHSGIKNFSFEGVRRVIRNELNVPQNWNVIANGEAMNASMFERFASDGMTEERISEYF